MKNIFLYVMVALYTIAGINHFVSPLTYLKIIPPWLPEPRALVYVSGIFEIAFGLLLVPASTRHIAAWLLIFLLIVIFPANIQMAINYWQKASPYLWIALLRLPLQCVLIWWAYLYTR